MLIAVLNEYECMKITMPKVDRRHFDRIVFLDGNSTDGTQQYARENGYEVIEQGTMGLREGLIHALKVIDTDWIMTFSPDGNCPPEDIPRLIEKMSSEDFDMVVASRYRDGAKSWDDTLTTKFGNFFFNFVINLLGGGRYTV